MMPICRVVDKNNIFSIAEYLRRVNFFPSIDNKKREITVHLTYPTRWFHSYEDCMEKLDYVMKEIRNYGYLEEIKVDIKEDKENGFRHW